ncbi:MAG: polymerase sigma factor, sigma-70 family [Bacillales bacterium]|jgi:RNA polymerase sigma-70 factor (ECF subfamily)|nr:polymerase sigma factor, sigma-70 family [Bacillales bacterium]
MNELYFYLVKQGADAEIAKEIVQESVYKSIVHIDSIDTDKYRAWLFKVALNLYFDFCRKNKLKFELLNESIHSNQKLTEELLIDNEHSEKVRKILKLLPVGFRQLLILKYELDWSYQKIGDYLDMNTKTVKTYLARARAKFKELYWGEGNE